MAARFLQICSVWRRVQTKQSFLKPPSRRLSKELYFESRFLSYSFLKRSTEAESTDLAELAEAE